LTVFRNSSMMIHLDGTPSEREASSDFLSKESCPRTMLAGRVLRFIERHRMFQPGDRVVVGLSGGADSMALTEVLFELRDRLEIELVLAHLNHGLRAEANDDEEFCRSVAANKGLPFVSSRIDVAERARKQGRSLEDAGREARYEFLDAQADSFEARKMALGHTLDDQAETFLLRLLRGSGARGLSGMNPVRTTGASARWLVRPLLEVRRADIEDYLDQKAAPFVQDPTNVDLRFTRNRIRHQELPRLTEAFNPRLSEALARSASLLREEEEWMEAETSRIFRALAEKKDSAVHLDRAALAGHPRALRRRLIRRAVQEMRGLEGISQRHVEDVLTLVEDGQSGQEIHLPGLVVGRSFGQIRFQRRSREAGYNAFEYRLTIPARVRIPECSGILSAQVDEAGREARRPPVGNAVVVGFHGSVPELRVRNPRSGDRFHPLGAPGSKPLSRYLMERRVSREWRTKTPILVRSGSGEAEEILWVVGHGVSEASRVSPGSSRLDLRWFRS
jgi:tRNA(Ile)-lysidine synthase